MANIDKKIEGKATELINHFMFKGALVSKRDYELVVLALKWAVDEIIEELKTN